VTVLAVLDMIHIINVFIKLPGVYALWENVMVFKMAL